MSGFKRLRRKTVLRSRVFRIDAETWRAPDGGTFERQTVVHPGAVAILPVDKQGRLILLRQFRPAAGGWHLEIPAGTLEKGETPRACAKRELVEEIGFAAKRWKKLGCAYTAPGFCSEVIHLFLAEDLTPAHAEQDADEHIETVRMTPAQVKRAARSGRLRDAKTFSALWLAGYE